MKHHILTLFIFALLLSLSCTNRQTKNTLHDVATFIEDRPDSALFVLTSFPKEALTTKGLSAQYSLLYAMALDKNYIDTTDVSIIEPAVEYYGKHGTADEKMKAYYYQGIAYFNNEEYDNAVVSFSIAEEMIPNANDLRYVGLVYSRLSDLYNRSYNAIDELKYIDLAADAFSRCGDEKYNLTTLQRKAQALTNARIYGEAESIYKQLLEVPNLPDVILNTTKEDYALLLASTQDRRAKEALPLYQEVISSRGGLRDVNFWASYAYSLAACGHKVEADQVFYQLYQMGIKNYSVVDIWKSAACENGGDYKNAYVLLQKSLTYQDSLLNIRLSQATAKAQMEYMALKNSQLEVEEKNNQLRFLAVIVLLVFISVILYFVYRNRNERLKEKQIELIDIAETMRFRLKESEEFRVLEKITFDDLVTSRNTEITSLRKEIDSREKTLSALRSEYAHMYKSQFKYLGDLCEAYLLANERKDSQRIVYEKVQEMIKDISSDKSGQRRFERMIDRSLDNIMKHFREDFPKYSEEDFRFISYIFVGFDATTLCIIFNMPSVAAVYMKKSRIKKTIQESTSYRKDKYLEMLD